MNREEAIKWLKAIEKKYIHGGDEEYDNLRKIALHMAMESLKQPTQSNASNVLNALDTIYRQAAIDAVHKNYDTILDFKSDGRTVADSFEDIINTLPSAQPEITEEDVKKYCRERCFAIVDGELFEEMKIRWSQPEIIRCEKCEHYTALTGICEVRGKGLRLIRRPDDFCSRAERREEGAD